eukprot:9482016-Pyramimonas_sp.AAC.1
MKPSKASAPSAQSERRFGRLGKQTVQIAMAWCPERLAPFVGSVNCGRTRALPRAPSHVAQELPLALPRLLRPLRASMAPRVRLDCPDEVASGHGLFRAEEGSRLLPQA